MSRVKDSGQGLLIVGHGTRDDVGRQEFQAVIEAVALRSGGQPVFGGFLELARPSIDEAIDEAVAQGVRQLTVMPLLLLAAGHAKQDIPHAVENAAGRHRGLATRMTSHLGCHPKILELSALRFQQAFADYAGDPPSADDLLLVVVGRGSRDEAAVREMHEFVDLRRRLTPAGRVETCFAAMAQPPLGEVLGAALDVAFTHVLVQPHLLFRGDLSARIVAAARRFGARNARQQWHLAAPLGPDELLIDAICEITKLGGQ